MDQELKVRIEADISDLKRRLKEGSKNIDSFSKDSIRSVDRLKSTLKGLASGVAAAFSVAAITKFAGEVLKVTAEFEKLGAVLGNTLGSKALADLKMKELQDFAAKTPFGVTELTNAFVKLANQGFAPTIVQIRQLGDLASSTGKSFDQLAEAIIDAQVGEYERLKEFGVRARDAGNEVIFTFKGVQTTVAKTSTAIREYITGLGDATGVSGSMAVISETLSGKISNLKDNYDQMLLSVGNNTSGAFSSAIGWIDKMITKITQLNNRLNIAEKYDLDGDFWQQVNRAFNPFASKGLTGREMAVGAILNAQKATDKLVSEIVTGAKSADDFQKGIEKLWAQMADARASGQAQKTINGVVDTINNGVKQLVEAREAFLTPKSKDAGFGGGKTGKTEAEKAAERLEKALIDSSNRVRLSDKHGRDKEIEQIKIWYDERLKLAKEGSAEYVRLQNDMRAEIAAVNANWDKKDQDEIDAFLKKRADKLIDNGRKIVSQTQKEDEAALKKRLKEEEAAARKLAEIQMHYARMGGDAIANAFEDILLNGKNIFQALGDEFKRMIVRMIAEAVALKAANLFSGLIGSALGGGGGLLGTLIRVGANIFGAGRGASPVASAFSGPIGGNSFSPSISPSASGGRTLVASAAIAGRDLRILIHEEERHNQRFSGGQ